MTAVLLTPERILFEDHHLVIVNKPAPLLTQAPANIPSLEAMVKEYIKEKYQKPAGVYLGVPHRLDRPVTGVICFARNTKAAQRVHEQFHARTVRKTYWALLDGDVQPDSGTWTDWIKKVPDQARVEQAQPDEPGAKLATLQYRVLQRQGKITLVEFVPETGRMHQLRVQAAWRGHPILGDTTYTPGGEPSANNFEQVISLHARSLELVHPFQKASLKLEAPVPETGWWCDFATFRRNDERA